MAVMLDMASPRRIGRYELLTYLGAGGMSEVHAALHLGLRKRVALKLLHPSLRGDDEAVERFLREGECAARISHPNVVAVYDVGIDGGVPYLVMELLEGECLETHITRRGRLPLEAAMDLMLPICRAASAAHAAGVIHRDIKPANIFLARAMDGAVVPKLVDFGVATFLERRHITGALGPIGTPQYMSPEQARGSTFIDERTDQYSLASMLFEMLTGREPFTGPDVDTVLERVARGQFPSLTQAVAGAPRQLEAVLARATDPLPAQRFASVREFAEALLPFASRRARTEWHVAAGQNRAQAPVGPLRLHTARSTATDRLRQAAKATRPARPARSRTRGFGRRMAVAGTGSLGLALGLIVGVARSHGEAFEEQSKASGSAQVAQQQADITPLRKLQLVPAHAHALLDQEPLGQGTVELPVLDDGRVHELRVVAPGFVPRVLFFRHQPPETSIALTKVSP